VLHTIDLDRGCFACMLGGRGQQNALHDDGRVARNCKHERARC
jgi:hypothetical protein